MTDTKQITQLLGELAHDPASHARMSRSERDALVNLRSGLAAVKRDAIPAPSADGALPSGDRPVGGTTYGAREVPKR